MTETKIGNCHCGAVEFEIELTNGLENVRRCNCSLCRRKGALMAGVPLSGLRVTKGEDALTLYQWNTKIARHYFCKYCGIYTHHQRRSDPTQFGFNIACIDDVDLSSYGTVPVGDGASMTLESLESNMPV